LEEFERRFKEIIMIFFTSFLIAFGIGLIGELIGIYFQNILQHNVPYLVIMIVILVISSIFLFIYLWHHIVPPINIMNVYSGVLLYDAKEKAFSKSYYYYFPYLPQTTAYMISHDILKKDNHLTAIIEKVILHQKLNSKIISDLIDYIIYFFIGHYSFLSRSIDFEMIDANNHDESIKSNLFLKKYLEQHTNNPSVSDTKYFENIPKDFKIENKYRKITIKNKYVTITIEYDINIIGNMEHMFFRPFPSILDIPIQSEFKDELHQNIKDGYLNYIGFNIYFYAEFKRTKYMQIFTNEKFLTLYNWTKGMSENLEDFFDRRNLITKCNYKISEDITHMLFEMKEAKKDKSYDKS
jgi:hypothetical protein